VNWIILSPHFDDAILSCGGLIWEKTRSGERVEIWTICAGEIPPGDLSPFAEKLHERWGTDRDSISVRREEDIHACQRVRASYRHFQVPDCIYRGGKMVHRAGIETEICPDHNRDNFFYPDEESIFGSIHPDDENLIDILRSDIQQDLPADACLVSPLAIGNHVDHQITRRIAESIGTAIWYYADFPYALKEPALTDRYNIEGWKQSLIPISSEGLLAWFDSIAAYQSQISTFWSSLEDLWKELGDYLKENGGIGLWKMPK
jgi:LmbE family N-acetylglucosaminyl deacetylase